MPPRASGFFREIITRTSPEITGRYQNFPLSTVLSELTRVVQHVYTLFNIALLHGEPTGAAFSTVDMTGGSCLRGRQNFPGNCGGQPEGGIRDAKERDTRGEEGKNKNKNGPCRWSCCYVALQQSRAVVFDIYNLA